MRTPCDVEKPMCGNTQTVKKLLLKLVRIGTKGGPCIQAPSLKGTIMNTLNNHLIALAIGLALSTSAMAQSMSKPDYTAGKDKISVDFKTDKRVSMVRPSPGTTRPGMSSESGSRTNRRSLMRG